MDTEYKISRLIGNCEEFTFGSSKDISFLSFRSFFNFGFSSDSSFQIAELFDEIENVDG